MVPLMAMLRHRAAAGSTVRARLLYSSRGPDDVIYCDELASLQAADDGLEVLHTFTRRQPDGWEGYARRIDARMLRTMRAMARLRGDDPAQVGLQAWVNHDIRRTVRTNLSRLRVSEEAREAVLAHVRPGIKQFVENGYCHI